MIKETYIHKQCKNDTEYHITYSKGMEELKGIYEECLIDVLKDDVADITLEKYMRVMGLAKFANHPAPTFEYLEDCLEVEGLNVWSYSTDDESEIENKDKVVLVKDSKGELRYYELDFMEVV